MKTSKIAIACALYTVILYGQPRIFAKNGLEQSCKVYFIVVEHDEETSNLNMTGLNHSQQEWYDKHGAKEAPGFCNVNGNATGLRVTPENGDEEYIHKVVGTSPFYSIAWEDT